jgi:potassium channel subfamily K, other eukaryote
LLNQALTLYLVIEEAGSSKYRNALHSKSFDAAVKKFRMRENRETEEIAARARPQIPRAHSNASLQDAAKAASAAVLEELERLPNEIMQQMRTFHSHMQYIANNADANWEEVQNPQFAKNSRTPMELRALLNEITKLAHIGERTKREILEDDDTRNVCSI